MRDGVAAAIEAGEIEGLDADAVATALYGAIRDLGARVANAQQRRKAADEAVAVLDLVLAGFATARPAPSARTARPARPTSTRTARQESA